MFFASASFFTTACLSLPDLRNASTLSGWPLYLAALFLKEGPSLSAETEWHFRQPPFLTAASPALASCAWESGVQANAAAIAITVIPLIFPSPLLTPSDTRITEELAPPAYWPLGQ